MPDQPTTLEARLAPLARAHEGAVAIAVRHLGTGERFALRADEPMPTASLIKVAVMAEVYAQAAEGRLRLGDVVQVQAGDKVPGAGILTDHFSPGASFPLRDAVRLMIRYSDNTATNLVLDHVGIASVTKRMAAWGFPHTRLNAKVFRGSTTTVDPVGSKKFGLGSTTANETVELFARVHAGAVVGPEASKDMLAHLKACDDPDMFPRFLPKTVTVAHKTGAVTKARTAGGVLIWKGGPVALCVLTNDNKDVRWEKDNAGEVLCANVAKAVYDHYSAADERR